MTTDAASELEKLINDCLPLVTPGRRRGLAQIPHLDRSNNAPSREQEAIAALILAIRCHYPSVYHRLHALHPEVESFVSQEVEGRIIKLARIARALLAEHL